MAGENQRRWIGGIILGMVVVMVVLGQTVLKPGLGGWGYLIYWLVCICLTCLALVHAFVDLHRIRQHSREQQRDLIENTLGDLPEKAREPGAQTRRKA